MFISDYARAVRAGPPFGVPFPAISALHTPPDGTGRGLVFRNHISHSRHLPSRVFFRSR
jgi:hypothetical protein